MCRDYCDTLGLGLRLGSKVYGFMSDYGLGSKRGSRRGGTSHLGCLGHFDDSKEQP